MSKNTYRELSMPELLRKLADSPNRRFGFRGTNGMKSGGWDEGELTDVRTSHNHPMPYQFSATWCDRLYANRIAEIIEIPDPLIPLKKLEALRELYPEHEWIAMDSDESACLFKVNSPIKGTCTWSNDYDVVSVPALDGYATDWRESLIHIPTEIERLKGLEGGQ